MARLCTLRAGALLCSSVLGCSTPQMHRQALSWSVTANPQIYLELCGRVVAGVQDVQVEESRWRSTAHVSAQPIPWGDDAAGERCQGELEFDSALLVSPNSRGDEQTNALWNVRLRGHTPFDRPAPVRWQDDLTLVGRLAGDVSVVRAKRLANEYAIELPARVPLTFEMSAVPEPGHDVSTLDPRLELWRGGKAIAVSTPGDHTSSRLDTWVRDAGAYTLRATSERDDGNGPYGLEMRRSRHAELWAQTTFPLALGETVTGELDASLRDHHRSLSADYEIALPDRVALSFVLEASDDPRTFRGHRAILPHLDLLLGGHVLSRSDDAAVGVARIDVTLEAGGNYILRVSTRDADTSGGVFTLGSRR